jgi:hypothetical protein
MSTESPMENVSEAVSSSMVNISIDTEAIQVPLPVPSKEIVGTHNFVKIKYLGSGFCAKVYLVQSKVYSHLLHTHAPHIPSRASLMTASSP